AEPHPPDPAHGRRDGLHSDVPDRAPDGLAEVEARVAQPPSHRQVHADVAARVLHERDEHAEWQPDPRLRLITLAGARELKPAHLDLRPRVERIAVDAA